MLRTKKSSNSNKEKRQSMFLDHLFSHDDQAQRKVRDISHPFQSTPTSLQNQPKHHHHTHRSSRNQESSKNANRNSIIFDPALVRDYSLAIDNISKPEIITESIRESRTRSRSDSSLSSKGSGNSLFSKNDNTSVHDLMYEVFDEILLADNSSTKLKSVNPNKNVTIQDSKKALFLVKDNVYHQGEWVKPTVTEENDDEVELDVNLITCNRTSLIFF